MAVGVLVVVAERQLPQLPAEALAAGVVFPGWTPAVAPPIAKGFRDALEAAALHEHRAAFPHGQMVRRIKALRRQVAKRAGALSFVG